MKTIFSTVLLVLVLPWKLSGGETLSPSASNHEGPTVREKSAIFLQSQDENTTLTTDPRTSHPDASDGTFMKISRGTPPINSTTVEASFLINNYTNTKDSSTGLSLTVSTGSVDKTDMKAPHLIATRAIATKAETNFTDGKDQMRTPSRYLQTTPELITKESEKVSVNLLAGVQTSKHASENPETKDIKVPTFPTGPPNLYTNASDRLLVDITHGQTNNDAVPINSSTIKAISTNSKGTSNGPSSTVNTGIVSFLSEEMATKTTHKIDTRTPKAETDISPPQQVPDKHANESTTQNAIVASRLSSENFSVMSYAKGQTTIARTSTGESKPSSHLSSEGWIRESMHAFHRNQTTPSKEDTLSSNEASNTPDKQKILQTTAYMYNTSGNFQTTAERVTQESENQETKDKAPTSSRNDPEVTSVQSTQTHTPALIWTSKMEVTFPQKNVTNPSSVAISTVNTENITTAPANKEMTSGKHDKKVMTTEEETSTTLHALSPTTQPTQTPKPTEGTIMQSTKAETSKPSGKKIERGDRQPSEKPKQANPGPIVAGLITTILVLMGLAILIILVMKHRRRKKQMKNSDWAGPSPFLESSIDPKLPKMDASDPLHCNKLKRISLHSFLPQQLSYRLSVVPEDEVHMVDISAGCTFSRNGRDNVPSQDEKVEMEENETQMHQTDQSPPAEPPPPDFPATETLNAPTAPVNGLSVQETPHPEDETIPTTPSETSTVAPSPSYFQDVDLDPAQGQTSKSTTIPTPPPPPPPPPPTH